MNHRLRRVLAVFLITGAAVTAAAGAASADTWTAPPHAAATATWA